MAIKYHRKHGNVIRMQCDGETCDLFTRSVFYVFLLCDDLHIYSPFISTYKINALIRV